MKKIFSAVIFFALFIVSVMVVHAVTVDPITLQDYTFTANQYIEKEKDLQEFVDNVAIKITGITITEGVFPEGMEYSFSGSMVYFYGIPTKEGLYKFTAHAVGKASMLKYEGDIFCTVYIVHAHVYTVAAVVEADCENGGYTLYTCTKCEDSYKDNETAPLGHDYSNGICTRCGKSDPDYVPSLNGSVTENDTLYYYKNNIKQSGWFKDNGKTYYASIISKEVFTHDKIIGGKLYLWDDNSGLLPAQGFIDTNEGTSCYYDGKRVYGWRHSDGSPLTIFDDGTYEQYSENPNGLYYFLSTTGFMVKDETYILGGYLREFNEDHTVKALNGLQSNGGAYYYYTNGAKQIGWREVNGNKYYFLSSNGKAASMWQEIGGRLYYFYSSTSAIPCALKTSGPIGGIDYVYDDLSGSITFTGFMNPEYAKESANNTAAYIGKINNTTRYYVNGVPQHGWQSFNGNMYYFYVSGSSNGDGNMCVSSRKIGGIWYEFTAEGVCTNKE